MDVMGAAGLAAVLSQSTAPATGGENLGFLTGVVISWDSVTQTNVIRVKGTNIPNVAALQAGIGLTMQPGDNVVLMRVNRQYLILGKSSSAGGSNVLGSGPANDNQPGGLISTAGTSGVFRDLDGGATLSPRVPVRIGSNAMVLFGVKDLEANNADVEISLAITGDTVFPPNTFAGQSIRAGINNQQNGGSTIIQAPSGCVMWFKNTGVNPYWFRPGTMTFYLQYRLTTYNNGTGVQVTRPWITVIPF